MGEKDDTMKAAADSSSKKEDGPITAVLKLDLHCQGCAKKVSRSVRHFEGVENVKADSGNNELTVIGKVDPIWLRDRVAYKTKKKVELISPQPKKDGCGGGDGGGGNEKSDQKSQKKLQGKNGDDRKSKELTDSTVVMKIKLHCHGCAHKIERTILKNIDGVSSIKTDLEKDLITVNGKMNVKELTAYLKERLKKSVEIVHSKKDDCHEDKKGKEGGGGRDKKEKRGGNDNEDVRGVEESKGDEKKMEINKMEFQGYNPQTYHAFPMYNQIYANQDYGVTMHNQSYTNAGDVVQYIYRPLPPVPPPTYVNVNDQMFSDENPNACFVM